jgi:2',3'-cyclic-nucleotide 2'-phosphodiesterase
MSTLVRLLFVGDVVGRPGRRALQRVLPSLIDERLLDYVIVNIENSAGGVGVTPEVYNELSALPIDCFTTGNHVWDKREGLPLLDREARLLRPANYPAGNPGHGLYVGETAAGIKVATLNLEGQVFMKNLDSPFQVADRLVASLPADVKIVVVDFHAEATSEKQALGYFLDGRVSAVFGTHTHVPTADTRILPQGTAFQTDAGMTGPYDSIIGFKVEDVLQRFALQRGINLEPAKKDARLAGVYFEVDADTGHAVAVERLLIAAPE